MSSVASGSDAEMKNLSVLNFWVSLFFFLNIFLQSHMTNNSLFLTLLRLSASSFLHLPFSFIPPSRPPPPPRFPHLLDILNTNMHSFPFLNLPFETDC